MAERTSSAVTLQRILNAARKEFAEHGLAGAKLDAIARAANVTKQLVYHYYKSKNELYSVVLDTVSEETVLVLEDPDYETLPPEAAIRRFIERVVLALSERPYMVAMTLDEGFHHGEHVSRRSRFVPTVKMFVDKRIAPILRRGAAEGVFRPDIDPYLFYWSAQSLIQGVFLQGWVFSDSTGKDFEAQEGIDLWREHSIDFILRSLAAVPPRTA